MSRRKPSKWQMALQEAHSQREAAQRTVGSLRAELNTAIAVRDVYAEVYESLAQTLKAARSPKEPGKSVKEPMCGLCGYEAEHSNHDMSYISSHPFDGPSTAQPVKRRSSRKKETDGSIASIATDKGNAGIVLPDNPDDFKVA